MFTGIVQGTGEIVRLDVAKEFARIILVVPTELAKDVQLGASVSVHGVCLTVAEIDGATLGFDVMRETLEVTNLGMLHVGDRVNLERSMRFGDEVGGHVMSGHILGTAEVMSRLESPGNVTLRFRFPRTMKPYIFEKGFIGVNGCSLTVTSLENNEFSVWLIPETLRLTTFDIVAVGDRVNIEIDPKTQVIVDTVERIMREKHDYEKNLPHRFNISQNVG